MTPFVVDVPEKSLDDLKIRLRATRWPDELPDQSWKLGADLHALKRLCHYWGEQYDWRESEARLNGFPQFRAEIDGVGLHFIHARSGVKDAVPLLLTNGWPSSIFEYLDLIPRLTASGFHIVAPALPGYGFSDRPTAFGMNATRIAGLFATLMSKLGYERFLAHGSDMGGGVVERLTRKFPERLLGAHFSNVFWGYPRPDDNPSKEERDYFNQLESWRFAEGAYAMVQATKPQTLAYGLNDSPAGLAGWIYEKFQAWSDGDAEQLFGLDGLCANLTVYWATQTIGSSCRLYAEQFADQDMQRPPEKSEAPVGVIVFPKDLVPAPRAWGERWLNLTHWTEAPRGGHFAAWETPDLLAEDLQAFAATLKP